MGVRDRLDDLDRRVLGREPSRQTMTPQAFLVSGVANIVAATVVGLVAMLFGGGFFPYAGEVFLGTAAFQVLLALAALAASRRRAR